MQHSTWRHGEWNLEAFSFPAKQQKVTEESLGSELCGSSLIIPVAICLSSLCPLHFHSSKSNKISNRPERVFWWQQNTPIEQKEFWSLNFHLLCEILTKLNKVVPSLLGLGVTLESQGWKVLSIYRANGSNIEGIRTETVLGEFNWDIST